MTNVDLIEIDCPSLHHKWGTLKSKNLLGEWSFDFFCCAGKEKQKSGNFIGPVIRSKEGEKLSKKLLFLSSEKIF